MNMHPCRRESSKLYCSNDRAASSPWAPVPSSSFQRKVSAAMPRPCEDNIPLESQDVNTSDRGKRLN